MLKIISVCFCFLTVNLYGQNTLQVGQGVLQADLSKQATLSFYNDTSQLKPSKKLSVVINADGNFEIKNQKEVSNWFSPEQIHLDYSIFVIRVDTVIGKWYKVVINNKQATTMWTKTNSNLKYNNWTTFFKKQVTSIQKDNESIDIKVEPNESSKTIKKIESADCFEVLDVKGDWLKVRTHTILECSESKKPIRSGWLKWKNKNKLTINFGLGC